MGGDGVRVVRVDAEDLPVRIGRIGDHAGARVQIGLRIQIGIDPGQVGGEQPAVGVTGGDPVGELARLQRGQAVPDQVGVERGLVGDPVRRIPGAGPLPGRPVHRGQQRPRHPRRVGGRPVDRDLVGGQPVGAGGGLRHAVLRLIVVGDQRTQRDDHQRPGQHPGQRRCHQNDHQPATGPLVLHRRRQRRRPLRRSPPRAPRRSSSPPVPRPQRSRPARGCHRPVNRPSCSPATAGRPRRPPRPPSPPRPRPPGADPRGDRHQPARRAARAPADRWADRGRRAGRAGSWSPPHGHLGRRAGQLRSGSSAAE